jgi:hypothetical protein
VVREIVFKYILINFIHFINNYKIIIYKMVLKHGGKMKYKCPPKKGGMVSPSPLGMCPTLGELIGEARYSPSSSGCSTTVGMVGPYGMRVVM